MDKVVRFSFYGAIFFFLCSFLLVPVTDAGSPFAVNYLYPVLFVLGFALLVHTVLMLYCIIRCKKWTWLCAGLLLLPLATLVYYLVAYDRNQFSPQ